MQRKESEHHCPGCGEKVTGHGRRKWCSERCRKASYGDPCIDCGARTSYGAETARVPEPRCTGCRGKLNSALWAERYAEDRDRFVQMWRAGVSSREIAEAFGWTDQYVVSRKVINMRALGYEMPYRYEAVARRHAEAA